MISSCEVSGLDRSETACTELSKSPVTVITMWRLQDSPLRKHLELNLGALEDKAPPVKSMRKVSLLLINLIQICLFPICLQRLGIHSVERAGDWLTVLSLLFVCFLSPHGSHNFNLFKPQFSLSSNEDNNSIFSWNCDSKYLTVVWLGWHKRDCICLHEVVPNSDSLLTGLFYAVVLGVKPDHRRVWFENIEMGWHKFIFLMQNTCSFKEFWEVLWTVWPKNSLMRKKELLHCDVSLFKYMLYCTTYQLTSRYLSESNQNIAQNLYRDIYYSFNL